MIRVVISAFFLALTTASAFAQGLQDAPISRSRYIYLPDMDIPGNDLRSTFDTSQQACARSCTSDPTCAGFTFNTRSNACFAKSVIETQTPYVGAISARKVTISEAALTAAEARRMALPFLTQEDVNRARNLVDETARAFPAGLLQEADLRAALTWANAAQDYAAMRRAAGALASLTDSSAAWRTLSAANLRLPDTLPARIRNSARREAVPAALNAVLRAGSAAEEVNGLDQLARALEATGRGAQTIPTLRRALALSPRDDLQARLDDMLGKYGFRVTSHQVDNASAAPRICAEFSEPLAREGVDYDQFVSVPGITPVTEVTGAQLCLLGVTHGAEYDVTLRAGLPAASGEVTQAPTRLRLYVRDRPQSVRFPGRGYVLPNLDGAALPVTVVNASRLDLVLRRVSDRNVLRAMQDDLFARPLSAYAEGRFSKEIASELWRGTAEVESALNRDSTSRLPLGDMLADRAPGIYALTARAEGADPYADAGATQWFVVSDLGLTSLQGTQGLHVAVRGLRDAQARGGVQVSLVSRANGVLAEALTDAEGFVQFPAGVTRGTAGATPALLLARSEDDFTFLALTGPAFDLSDRGVAGRSAPGPIDAFVTLDRGAYRVGEQIGATVLLRDAGGVQGLPDLPLVAVLQRPDGVEYSRTPARAMAEGGYVFQLPLGADVPRGTWRLDITLGTQTPPLSSRTFLVEDFLPERIDVELTLPDGPMPRAAGSVLGVTAEYLFGAPGAGLAVAGQAILRQTRALEAWPGYEFGRYDSDARAQGVSVPSARTDAAGQAHVPIALPMPAPGGALEGTPFVVDVTLQVSEGSGRPVERTLRRAVARSGPIVGIRPGFEGSAGENSTAEFEIVALNPNGAALSGRVSWVLNRIETRYQWYQLYGNWNWEPITRRARVATGALDLNAAPGTLPVPLEWGDYELVTVLDGTQVAGSVRFSAGWSGGTDRSTTPDRVEVSLDRPSYAVGEVAQVRVNAARGGTALVSVLTSDVVSRQIVDVPDGGARIPLRVTDGWGSSAYVTVSLLAPLASDDPAPARRVGVAHAQVVDSARSLDVTLDVPAPRDGQPGATEVTVKVAGLGAGETAYLTLSAVDLGILNLTAHAKPDPLAHYFGQRRLGVELRDLYGRLIDGQAGPLGSVRSGGDAGAQMRMQAPPPMDATMVFFSGMVETDAQGIARVSVPRPAFNGTIRLDAVAWTQSAVGQASTEIIARDPVVVSASLPRFLAPGDDSRLLLELQPTGAVEGMAGLAISAPGLILGEMPSQVALMRGEPVRLDVPISAAASGDVPITIALTLPEGQVLTKILRLQVRQSDPEVAVMRRFRLGAGKTFHFDNAVFAGLRAGSGHAVLTAGPLARLNVPGLLDQLDRVPYGCTEQITSGALPLLSAGAFAPNRDITQTVEQAIARVLTRQTSGGSFGLWRAQSGAFWLDAYVTDFLIQARAAGYDVPDPALRLAVNNLQNRVNYAPDFDWGGADIAYALFVLAKQGRASVADLRYYADTKRGAFSTPLARAQLGAALASYGDTLRADAMFAAAGAQLADAPGRRAWRDDFGSAVSDRAGVLRLAIEAGSDALDRGRLASGLVPERTPSTQDAAQLVRVAAALRGAQDLSGLTVNGVSATGPVVHRRAAGSQAEAVAIRNTSADGVDVTVTTIGVPEVAPPAGGQGYAITRRMFTPEGQEITGAFKAGEQRVIVLSVTPFEDVAARLMVEDPLPAGLEIDTPTLLRSGSVEGLDWLQLAPTQSTAFLADRFRAAVDVTGTQTVHLAYKLRAVTPGHYHHPAAHVHDMYRPDYRAVTETGRLDVLR